MIIIAIDGMTKIKALNLAEKLKNEDIIFKVNDLLDDNPAIIKDLNLLNKKVMCDAKLHDIPNTIENRIKKLALYNPEFITIHASGGIPMMEKAVNVAGNQIKILAVTVLTSLNEKQCELIFGTDVETKVINFAFDALKAGVFGIVCSPNELKIINKYPELSKLKKIVPGIRLENDNKDDQSRVNNIYNTIINGADYLVIGRMITNSSNPENKIKLIQSEIKKAKKTLL